MKHPKPSLLVGLLFVFLPSLVVFILLDVTWIALVGGSIYKTVLGSFLRSTPQIVPGLLAWVCIVGSVYLFALPNTRTPAAAIRQLHSIVRHFNHGLLGNRTCNTRDLQNTSQCTNIPQLLPSNGQYRSPIYSDGSTHIAHQLLFEQGLLLGLCLYGTYEFTNLSILVPWTWALALVDTAWGSIACGVAAGLQSWIYRKLLTS
ncbi:hypothetical protein Vafri_16500 [Volvox africanus]|uniref:Uncharacterized protein n=1 Tax=Volvox africanus TaxID=51714 RepID=A0A8J4BHG0_9CHLO|nr:hypothetical protein Vafri_16500 [Volvox africanus]